MNLAELLLLGHILFVIIGFGGAIGFHVIMPMAARSTDLAFVRTALKFGFTFENLAFPGFLIAGLIGLGLSLYQEWDFGENTWLNISATLWVIAVLISFFILRPALRRLDKLAREAPGPEVPPELTAEFKKPLQFITPNLLTLIVLVIVYLMIAKPGVDFTGIDHWPVNT
jgi:uncharacterized membrane protein